MISSHEILRPLIWEYVKGNKDKVSLLILSRVKKIIFHISQKYPSYYFELGVKNDDSITSLANRTFTHLTTIKTGWFPFNGRIPFKCYVEENFNDDEIMKYSFYSKLSIMWQIMKEDYSYNSSHIPEVARSKRLFEEIGETLKAHFKSFQFGQKYTLKWGLPFWDQNTIFHQTSIDNEEVINKLLELGELSLEEIIEKILKDFYKRPMSQSQLANIIFQIYNKKTTTIQENIISIYNITPELLTIRRIVSKYYNLLTPSEKKILFMIKEGLPYKEIAIKMGYKDFQSVGKEMEKIAEKFLTPLIKEFEPSSKKKNISISHKDLIENILEIIEDMEKRS